MAIVKENIMEKCSDEFLNETWAVPVTIYSVNFCIRQ